MMKILVTGGTGFIGSHTVVELVERGYQPVLLDNLNNSREEVVQAIEKITGKGISFFNIDLCNHNELKKFFTVYKVDACIHFAAHKAVGESVINPLKYYHNNILSLSNLLEAYVSFGLNNFVFSSSCSVYGDSPVQPVQEDTPLCEAQSPYAYTKQVGERMAQDFVKAYNKSGISLRYFNPAGAHPSALIGEYPLQAPTNLVPVITQTAIGIRKEMSVFGNDYNTPDGTCVRDYIHVMDIAKAHVDAIEFLFREKKSPLYDVFNLGTGRGNTVLEVIQAFERISGQKLNYSIANRRAGDVEKVYAHTKKANEVLGWKAQLSLDEIMRTAWAWEKRLRLAVSGH